MKDRLISFETAKLAKEKGFDLSCNDVYATSEFYPKIHNWQEGLYKNKTFGGDFARLNWKIEEFLNAPTQSLLQKWLRDEYNIFVFIDYKIPPKLARYNIWDNNTGYEEKVLMAFGNYEEALEKGLHEALKLI